MPRLPHQANLSRPQARAFAAAALLLLSLGGAAGAETRDFGCTPTAVRIDEQRLEILCAEPMVLNDRSQDRFRQVERVAFPMVTQNLQPQLGSQFKLLDFYLEVAQTALVHGRTLHVWFESDFSRSQLYGCDPVNCRELVGLAITHERAASPTASN